MCKKKKKKKKKTILFFKACVDYIRQEAKMLQSSVVQSFLMAVKFIPKKIIFLGLHLL